MDILALNPSRKPSRKRAAKKEVSKTMARKRSHKTHPRKHSRRNPGNPSFARVRGHARRAYSKARGFLSGHGIMETFKTALPVLGGLALALVFRKKFGDAAGVQQKWTWKDYLVAALGGLTGSLVTRHMFKTSPQTSNLFMLGAVTLMGYKLIEEQIVPHSKTLENWVGQDEEEDSSEYEGGYETDGVFGFLPGDTVQSESGQVSVLGDDGVWRPEDAEEESDVEGYGDVLQTPGRLGETFRSRGVGETFRSRGVGDVLQTPGRLGADPWGHSPY